MSTLDSDRLRGSYFHPSVPVAAQDPNLVQFGGMSELADGVLLDH